MSCQNALRLAPMTDVSSLLPPQVMANLGILMVPRTDEAAGRGPSFQPLDEVPVDALVARLQRRVAGLERQLEARIAEIGRLHERLSDQERQTRAARDDAKRAQVKADELDALLGTFTMRALRRPREWYGAVRRRLGR